MSSLFTRLGIRFTFRFAPARAPSRSRPARMVARSAVACGVVGFALATASLTVTVETVKPEWRDPEYGYRLRQLRKWKAEAPDRPLVLVLGSSRTQMGISPAAMALPDGPTDPIVYNFGYRGGQPVWTWLNLMRLLDRGIHPDFVLVQIALAECVNTNPAERQLANWTERLSLSDIRRLRPYTEDELQLPVEWIATRLSAWSGFSAGIQSDLWPDWQPQSSRRSFTWEFMDLYGFAPYPSDRVTAAQRDEQTRAALRMHHRSVAGGRVSEIIYHVHRDLVERCTAEGIAVAFAWAPESPRYRGAYGAAGPESIEVYTRFLTEELKVPVFPAPISLAEEDFADGHHLLPTGAESYSRWLADTHLKPWLARQLK